MSAPVVVRVVGEERPVGLPPVVLRKIAAFLAAGKTGAIELHVTQGNIRNIKLTEVARLDTGDQNGQDSAQT